jgi:hypothetical protein
VTGHSPLPTPSRRLRDGIERYAQTLDWAFSGMGVEYRRVDLRGSGPLAHARMLMENRSYMQAGNAPVRIAVTHRPLLPVASLLTRGRPGACPWLVCHGIEEGGPRLRLRQIVETIVIPRATAWRRPASGSLTATVLFFLLLIIPFNRACRATARGSVELSTGQAVAAAPTILRQVLASDLSPSGLAKSAEYLTIRMRSIDGRAIIMQRTPTQIPYSSAAVLGEAPVTNLIPRILWPGKPSEAVGYLMSQQDFDLPPSIYTSSNVTPEGDLYRHGSWVPLVAGMFLLGSVIRILDDVTDLRAGIHGAYRTTLLFPVIVQAGSDWSTPLSGIPEMVLLWFSVTAFAFARRSAAPRASA